MWANEGGMTTTRVSRMTWYFLWDAKEDLLWSLRLKDLFLIRVTFPLTRLKPEFCIQLPSKASVNNENESEGNVVLFYDRKEMRLSSETLNNSNFFNFKNVFFQITQ